MEALPGKALIAKNSVSQYTAPFEAIPNARAVAFVFVCLPRYNGSMPSRAGIVPLLIVLSVLLLSGCQPAAEANVLGYLLARQLDSLTTPASSAAGAIEGRVREADGPIPGATVLVAERSGRAHTARTDAEGRYRIDGVPADGYTVASVAAGYGEAQLHNVWGGPVPVTVRRGETVTAPDLHLSPLIAHDPAAFDLASLQLRQTAAYTAAAPFPAA